MAQLPDSFHIFHGRYQAALLTVGTELHRPGMLVQCHWEPGRHEGCAFCGLDPQRHVPVTIFNDGYAWDLVSDLEPAPTQRIDSAFTQQVLSTSFDLTFGAQLPQFGVEFDAALGLDRKLELSIAGVQAEVFENSATWYHLRSRLEATQRSEPGLWESVIADDLLIVESYFAQRVTIAYQRRGNVSLKGAFERGQMKARGNVDIKWHHDDRVTVEGGMTVPFAVRKWRMVNGQ